MAQLKDIWLNSYGFQEFAIRIDWDNDRHQRIEFNGKDPQAVARALEEARILIEVEHARGEI